MGNQKPKVETEVRANFWTGFLMGATTAWVVALFFLVRFVMGRMA